VGGWPAGDLGVVAALAAVTLVLGLLLGFVRAGGAGLVVAPLTGVFRLPIDRAIGTALAAMCFVTVAGAVSHYREGNVAPRIGVVVGAAGALGAVAGADAESSPQPDEDGEPPEPQPGQNLQCRLRHRLGEVGAEHRAKGAGGADD